MNKDFVKKEFIYPVISAIIAVILVAVALSLFLGKQYFYNNTVKLAEHAVADAVSVDKTDKAVRELIKPDTSIGSVKVGNTELPLLFSPDYADSKGCFCQLDNGILVSEVGNAIIYCNKKNGTDVRKLVVDDLITVNTFYGEYKYRVVGKEYFDGDVRSHSFDSGVGRGVTLYTSRDEGIGLSSRYVAFNCELVYGKPPAE